MVMTARLPAGNGQIICSRERTDHVLPTRLLSTALTTGPALFYVAPTQHVRQTFGLLRGQTMDSKTWLLGVSLRCASIQSLSIPARVKMCDAARRQRSVRNKEAGMYRTMWVLAALITY